MYKLNLCVIKNQSLSTGRKYSFSGTMTEDDFLNCLLWAVPNRQRLFVPYLYFPLVYPHPPSLRLEEYRIQLCPQHICSSNTIYINYHAKNSMCSWGGGGRMRGYVDFFFKEFKKSSKLGGCLIVYSMRGYIGRLVDNKLLSTKIIQMFCQLNTMV